MIIIGSTDLTSKLGRGTFFCPQCECRTGYQLKSSRPFLTLYFIPVFPLGNAERNVECIRCGFRFPERVLLLSDELESAATSGNFFVDIKRIMILTMIAGGMVDEVEIAMIEHLYADMTDGRIGREDIEDEVAMAWSSKTTVLEYVRRIAMSIDVEQKEMIVEAVFLVATASGKLDAAREEQLGGLSKALGITQTRYRSVINNLVGNEEAVH